MLEFIQIQACSKEVRTKPFFLTGRKDVPLVMLGDPAYPLLPWLMKVFPDNGHFTLQQKHLNYRLSRARVLVKHAYSRLKGTWRCLLKHLDVATCDAPVVVSACCVLHNICEKHGEMFDQEWMEGSINRTLRVYQQVQAMVKLKQVQKLYTKCFFDFFRHNQ